LFDEVFCGEKGIEEGTYVTLAMEIVTP